MTTLRQLHKELNITQRLSLYVKNQNKKYKPQERLEADTKLSRTQETLIRINTLGKQRMHSEQAKMIHEMTGDNSQLTRKVNRLIAEKTALVSKLRDAENKAKRAENIVNNANMRDYIIKLYRVANEIYLMHTGGSGSKLNKEQEELAIKYTKSAYKYVSKYAIHEILVDEANKLVKYLEEKEGK